MFLPPCRIISSNRSHIVKLPLSRVRMPDITHTSVHECFIVHLGGMNLFSVCVSLSPPQWLSQQLKFMHTSHQFLLLSSPPAKEARFRTAKKLYGSTFAFQWVRCLLGRCPMFFGVCSRATFASCNFKCFKSFRQVKMLWEIIHAAYVILYKTFPPLLLSGKYYAGNYSQIKHCG